MSLSTVHFNALVPLNRGMWNSVQKQLDSSDKCIALDQAIVPVGAELAHSSKPLLGTWINCDKETRGIVNIEITMDSKGLVVHAYGACYPDPCDWGAVSGHSYSSKVSSPDAVAFTAVNDAGFAETLLTGHLEHGCLIVEIYTNFKDGSGRYDYYIKECFCKCA